MKHLLDHPHYILSVENPKIETDHEKISHDKAVQILSEHGDKNVYPVLGVWGGNKENSIFISSPTDKQKNLARAMSISQGQECHIESDGKENILRYHPKKGGVVTHATGSEILPSDHPTDFTQLPDGTKFRHNLTFLPENSSPTDGLEKSVRSPKRGMTLKQLSNVKDSNWYNADTGMELAPDEAEAHYHDLLNNYSDKKVKKWTAKPKAPKPAQNPEDFFGILPDISKSQPLQKTPLIGDYKDSISYEAPKKIKNIKQLVARGDRVDSTPYKGYTAHTVGNSDFWNNGENAYGFHFITDNNEKHGEPIAYAQVSSGDAPDIEDGIKGIYVNHAYTVPDHLGNGYHAKLISHAANHHGTVYSDTSLSPEANSSYLKLKGMGHDVELAPTHPTSDLYGDDRTENLPTNTPHYNEAVSSQHKVSGLRKGSLQSKFRFNPKSYAKDPKNLDNMDRVFAWQGYGYKPQKHREAIEPIQGNARFRALHKLAAATKVRRAADGGREFLLHRGDRGVRLLPALPKGMSNDTHVSHSTRSSWTPKYHIAANFGFSPATGATNVDSAWIHENKIVTSAKQYGNTAAYLGGDDYARKNNFGAFSLAREGKNPLDNEHEIIVEPHVSERASFEPKDFTDVSSNLDSRITQRGQKGYAHFQAPSKVLEDRKSKMGKSLEKGQEDTVRIYRGLTKPFDPNYDNSRTDAPSGYSTWTDSENLAREYSKTDGKEGHVYYVDLPKDKMGRGVVDENPNSKTYGDRHLFFHNDKPAGINGVKGKEYLLYHHHDLYNPAKILNKKDRCWTGYKPVAGKKPYSKGSCAPIQKTEPLVRINPEHGKIIANAYEQMKHDPAHPKVKESYNALINETSKQYQDLLKEGYRFTPVSDPSKYPYKNSKEMHFDIEQNKHLAYFPTESGFGSESSTPADHPLLSPTSFKTADGKPMLANDLLRQVHDINGHFKGGRTGFGPKGEHQSYLHHRKMYSPKAQPALASELMGQNNTVNWGKHGEFNRANPSQTKFAEQKAGLLPRHIIEEDWHL